MQPTREDTPESSGGEIMVPATPTRPAGEPPVAGESQGGTAMILAFEQWSVGLGFDGLLQKACPALAPDLIQAHG
jgi:hypothetical protein